MNLDIAKRLKKLLTAKGYEVIMTRTTDKFIELDDSYTTGSSIMPQKKNPDMAELVRGKTGRVYGDLMALLTTLKGLPLAYNKDMQEDKEAIFDAVDTVKMCLGVFTPMISSMLVLKENMYKAAGKGFINATDLADYLVKKGMPFRTAYKHVGEIVAYCIKENLILENLPIEKYKEFDGVQKNAHTHISFKNVSFGYEDKKVLENMFGRVINGMAYANGSCNAEVLDILKKLGLRRLLYNISASSSSLNPREKRNSNSSFCFHIGKSVPKITFS